MQAWRLGRCIGNGATARNESERRYENVSD
jgi:hypothetical protein